MHRWGKIALFIGIGLVVAGYPKGRTNFNQGRKAQDLQDYDAAFEYYQKALKTDPGNAEYKIKFDQARFGAGQLHTKNGLKLREKGDLENAASEFRKAAFMDPSSVAAEQELRKTIEMIEDRKRAADATSEPPPDNDDAELASTPPQLKLRALDSQLEISKRTLASRQQSLKLTKFLESHGSNSGLDVSQSQQLVYTASETIPDLERQIQQQENLLSILLGENP